MTPEAAVAAELPAEAFEWAFGESVAVATSAAGDGGSSGGKTGMNSGAAAGGSGRAVKLSRTQPLHTQTRTHALAPIAGTPTRGPSVHGVATDGAPVVVLVHHMDENENGDIMAAASQAQLEANEEHKEREPGGTVDAANPNLLVVPTNTQAPTLALLERPSKIILHISVTDSGSGIAPSALPHLFQPYSQEKLSIMRTQGGTGLGLAIVKNIVAHMHGAIHVTTQVGKGSKFSLHLPIDCRKPGGSVAGGGDREADFDSDVVAADAELHSTVNRLRALHREEEEENEDLIESHLLDKFERIFHQNARGGVGGGGMGAAGGSDSNGGDTSGGVVTSESDDGRAGIAGGMRPKLSPPLHHAAPPAMHGGAVSKPVAANWLVGPQLSARSRVTARQQREASSNSQSSASTSHAGGGGSSGSSSRSNGGAVTFHDEVDAAMPVASPAAAGGFKPVAPSVFVSNAYGSGRPQIEGQPDAQPTPKAHHAMAVSSSSAAAATMSSLPLQDSSVAVDLLTASSGADLSSNLLWPAGSSNSAPASAELRTRQLSSAPTLAFLLVDDADVNLKILCKMLGTSIVIAGTKYRLHLTTACNGLDAMKKVEERFSSAAAASNGTGGQGTFHVILSDIVMPMADGFQFARLLREWENTHKVHAAPLVALTANALKADVDAYSAASFRWFVPKPFRRADLTGVLSTVLQDTLSDPEVAQRIKAHQTAQNQQQQVPHNGHSNSLLQMQQKQKMVIHEGRHE